MPLRDAAFALWWQRSTFVREAERASPEDLSDPVKGAAYGRLFAERLAQDRAADPDSGNFLRLKRAHPDASDAGLRDAILSAVAFDDDCNKYFENDSTDYWQRVTRAVAGASERHPGYLETTLRDARNWLAQNMR